MSEANLWQRVRGVLHMPPHRVCRKLTDQFTAGTPDAFAVIARIVVFLELKWLAWPKRPGTLVDCDVTVEQLRYLDMLTAAGASAYVLLGVGRDWFLLNHHYLPARTEGKHGKIRLPQDTLKRSFSEGLLGPGPLVVASDRALATLPEALRLLLQPGALPASLCAPPVGVGGTRHTSPKAASQAFQ